AGRRTDTGRVAFAGRRVWVARFFAEHRDARTALGRRDHGAREHLVITEHATLTWSVVFHDAGLRRRDRETLRGEGRGELLPRPRRRRGEIDTDLGHIRSTARPSGGTGGGGCGESDEQERTARPHGSDLEEGEGDIMQR